ncbi:ATP-binding cassette domain-containing protein [Salinibius halmophilus]|uniref:ATP-binding cassette domain-containing protein n=1 Tax=Salinibius halmophilus TaxID=1853216 RepID=UPI000E6759B3|nr:ATP-binding cassette domain-containing protein [Salinibius halmophilus]
MLSVDNVVIERDNWQCRFNFQLTAGQMLLISGASGAGKSTLLDALAGFTAIRGGEISWQGQSLLGLEPAQRPVSMLFQQNNVFEHLSVAQNLALGISGSRKLRPEQQARVTAIAERLQITDQLNKRCTMLSGGQQQRVALGRALLMQRPLLLLDEPFSALDKTTRLTMQALVKEMHDEFGLTTLVVSHQPEEMQAMVDAELYVDKGEANLRQAP